MVIKVPSQIVILTSIALVYSLLLQIVCLFLHLFLLKKLWTIIIQHLQFFFNKICLIILLSLNVNMYTCMYISLGTARLWDLKTGQELCSFDHQSAVRSVAFSHGDKMICKITTPLKKKQIEMNICYYFSRNNHI